MHVTAKKVEEEKTFVPIELTLRFDTLEEASKFRELFNYGPLASWLDPYVAYEIRTCLSSVGVQSNEALFSSIAERLRIKR